MKWGQVITAILNAIEEQVPSVHSYADGLKCLKDYGSLKGMNAMERRMAVKGAFTSIYDFTSHTLVLLDDVATTGSTLEACIRALKKSGAEDVRVLALSKDQRTLNRKICPACGRSMRIRTNSYTGEKFWGCSGYPLKQCDHTEPL